MILIVIVLATLAAGIGSVWLAAWLMDVGLGRQGDRAGPEHMLSLAAGALMATAFMHLLPEAFESSISPQVLFATLLMGLVLFFLLNKAELWHHGHEHSAGYSHSHSHGEAHAHTSTHPHPHPHDDLHAQPVARRHAHVHHQEHALEPLHGNAAVVSTSRLGGWTVLTGDSVHCFGDGILIASAFMADMRLGLVAALSVLAHEVPHHMGDLVVLRQSSPSRRAALIKVSLAGAVTALGGVLGYWLLDRLHGALPYFLVIASSSFIYVALADLIPQLQKQLPMRQTVHQVLWLFGGIGLVTLVARFAHVH